MKQFRTMLAPAIALVAACTGSIAPTGAEDTGGASGGAAGHASGGSRAGSSGGGSGGTVVTGDPTSPRHDDVNALACSTPGPSGGTTPLVRLTNAQLANTLRDLFAGIATVPDLALPQENAVSGFTGIAAGQTPSLSFIEALHGAVKTITASATSATALTKLAPCTAGASQATCGATFVKTFGKRAFRRPLADDEATRLTALFTSTLASSDYPTAIATTAQAILLAPQFAYRVEVGTSPTGNVVPLTSYEIASRLSYLLWDTMPDAALMQAADADELRSPDKLATAAKRLLADDRAHAVITKFGAQWLRFSKLDVAAKDAKAFPMWNDALRTSMRTSLDKFVDEAFWRGGTLDALLTDGHAFVDGPLASIYGVSAPSGSGQTLVDVGADRRSGILTQAGLMAAFAKATSDSPVYRGVFVLDRLLCADPPPPPPGVPPLAEPQPGDAPKTTRQRQEQSHNQPTCAACHKAIDGIGFGFEHYDAIGGYRDRDNGIPVDASGELRGTRDVDGKYDGAVELGRKLAVSSQVQQCVATQWFRYAFARLETDADACALKPIVDAFIASRADLQALLLATVTSDAFRHRSPTTP